MSALDSWTFYLGELALGAMPQAHAWQLRRCWPQLQVDEAGRALRWLAQGMSEGERTAQLATVTAALREAGALPGWRGELYRCEPPVQGAPLERGAALFCMERAAFRYFGLMSRAIHVNAMDPDGRWCCGRRALSKATDPGRLDNFVAGGLGAFEDALACARRELREEAGLSDASGLRAVATLRSTSWLTDGLHDEILHVFELPLPAGFVPRNQDGEVSEFLWLDRAAVTLRLAQGDFSPDAARVMRLAVGLDSAKS